VGDFNGDGISDILASPNSGIVMVWLGPLPTSGTQPGVVTSAQNSFCAGVLAPQAAGNLDGNASADVAIVNFGIGGGAACDSSTGGGTFLLGAPAATTWTFGPAWSDPQASANFLNQYRLCDVTGDGLDDLIAWGPGSNTVNYVFDNDGTATHFPSTLSAASASRTFALTNGDVYRGTVCAPRFFGGKTALVLGRIANFGMANAAFDGLDVWLPGTPPTLVTLPVPSGLGSSTTPTLAGDVDGDGRQDVVLSTGTSAQWIIYGR
jgi:hypothetical protein